MKLVELDWNPTDRQLRQFGLISLVALPALAWFWGGNATTIGIFAGVGVVLAGVGWARPQTLKWIFVGLCLVCLPIGLVVGELALVLIYFGLFAPMGLLFRLLNRDRLERTLDRQAATYWQPKKQPAGAASYFRQS